jgi:hypothetical protein
MSIKKCWLPLLAGFLLLHLVTGCESPALVSQRVIMGDLPKSQSKPTPGNSFYFLPKVELMLTAVLTNAPSNTNVLSQTVSMVVTNISIMTVSNCIGQIASPKATAPPLTLAVSANSLTLGTADTNCISLTSSTNMVTLTAQTNGVILTANNNASVNLTLPQGTNAIANITFVTTTNSVTLGDDVQGSLLLVTGPNYLHLNPQAGVCYLTTNSGPPAWTEAKSFLTLHPGTNTPATPLPGLAPPVTTTFSEILSVTSTNWTTVPATNWFYLVTVTNFFTPEPQGLFSLNIAADYLGQYSETYGITVDNNGFIQSVNASNADQTVQIVTEIAQTAAAIAGFPGGGGIAIPSAYLGTNATNQVAPTTQIYPTVVSVIFDPTSGRSIDIANKSIAEQFGATSDFPIKIVPENIDTNPLSSPALATDDYLTDYNDSFCGIAYRPLRPYIVDVYNNRAQFGPSFQQYLVMSPNQSPLLNVPVKRAPFVTRTTGLTFSSGLFIGANYSRPSQASAIFGLPVTFIGNYLSSVTNLLQLKLNIATAETGLQQQSVALQQQNLALISATTNLLEAAQVLQKMEAAKPAPATTAH